MSSEQSSKLICAKDAFLAETWRPHLAICKAKATRASIQMPSAFPEEAARDIGKGVTILSE